MHTVNGGMPNARSVGVLEIIEASKRVIEGSDGDCAQWAWPLPQRRTTSGGGVILLMDPIE